MRTTARGATCTTSFSKRRQSLDAPQASKLNRSSHFGVRVRLGDESAGVRDPWLLCGSLPGELCASRGLSGVRDDPIMHAENVGKRALVGKHAKGGDMAVLPQSHRRFARGAVECRACASRSAETSRLCPHEPLKSLTTLKECFDAVVRGMFDRLRHARVEATNALRQRPGAPSADPDPAPTAWSSPACPRPTSGTYPAGPFAPATNP